MDLMTGHLHAEPGDVVNLEWRDPETWTETTLLAEMARRGWGFPPPEELTDEDLPCTLWSLIRRLASLYVFLHSTDHLGDRELYERLWRRELPMPTDMPAVSGWEALHIDLIAGGSDEDVEVFLTYYADDQERDYWKRDFPDMAIPPRRPAPFDRDRLLPQWMDPREPMAVAVGG